MIFEINLNNLLGNWEEWEKIFFLGLSVVLFGICFKFVGSSGRRMTSGFQRIPAIFIYFNTLHHDSAHKKQRDFQDCIHVHGRQLRHGVLPPLRVLALTGGPTQPEMSGFTPVDGDNMVDLFSGDFYYTLPLMSVPDPNGAYPVNLNYNSGPGMEREASWVGLDGK